MNSLIENLSYISDKYLRFLKEESKRQNMPPKEYGIMLQKKKQKKRK